MSEELKHGEAAAPHPATDEQAKLANLEFAFQQWMDKTDWVQKDLASFGPKALGMHRADILKMEVDRLRALVRLHGLS